MIKRGVMLFCASVAASPAMAQDMAPQPKGANPGDDTIVVTAERSNRTVRNTATSVDVLTGKDIDRAPGVQTTYDALALIPNLVATRSANNAPAIRGIDGGGPAIGANAFFAGTRPRVNFLVDGRTLSFNEAIYIDGGIWDTQQIEVYRGAQSTLQGRNAVGGVIAIKTADPSFTWQGKVRGLIGEDDVRQISGAVGGPLIADVAAFRIAADFRRENAQVQTVPYSELRHPGRYRSLNLRGKLLIAPTGLPGFRTLLTLSYTDSYAPQLLSVKRPFDDYISSQTRATPNSATPRFRTRALAGIADASWQLADGITVSNFFTGTHFLVNRYVNAGNGIARIDGQEFTTEPRIRFGRTGDTLSGFLAGYWFHSQQHEAIDLFGGGTFFDKTLTRAVFGEASWKPSHFFDLTLGTRYEQENRDRSGGAGAFLINFHKAFRAFLPRATASFHPNEKITVGVTAGRGYNSGGAGFSFNPPFPSFTYSKETVWNYEGFIRSTLLGGRLTLDGNIFYNEYHGLQLPFIVGGTPAAPATVIRNADRATTYGAEGKFRFRAVEGLDLTGSAGLLKTRVNRYNDPNVQGNDLPRAPAFSFSAGLFATPLARLDVSADIRFTDAYYSDVFNNARGKTDPYATVNVQIGYRLGGARLFLSVTNMFNETTPVLITTGSTAATDSASMPLKRRVTGGLEMSF